MQTTLNKIRQHSPCANGWKKLLAHLGKTQADDEPVAIAAVVESNGFDDALWCLRAVEGCDKEIRLFVVWCARQVQHLMTDARSLAALDVAERFANGEASEEELAASWAAAGAAAWAAVGDATRAAAWAAVGVAVGVAVGAAAWAAARSAARSAEWDAARSAEWDAEWDAARSAQKTRLLEICAECAQQTPSQVQQ